jgi:hypothetical protein
MKKYEFQQQRIRSRARQGSARNWALGFHPEKRRCEGNAPENSSTRFPLISGTPSSGYLAFGRSPRRKRAAVISKQMRIPFGVTVYEHLERRT